MGTTPIFGFRYPEAGDAPNGPLQIRNLAEDVEADLDAVVDNAAAMDALLDEFSTSTLAAAPTNASSQTSYPIGLSTREATTGLGYPANGVLKTWRYNTGTRTAQILTSASTGAADVRQYTRSWGTGPAWTPWVETTNPTTQLRHTSLEVSTDVVVTGTTYVETDTLLRLTITAPPSGLATVTFGLNGISNTATGEMFMSVDVRRVSDSLQLIPPDDNRIAHIHQSSGTSIATRERTFLLTGMDAGVDYQIRGVYKVDAGTTGTWTRRWITCVPSS